MRILIVDDEPLVRIGIKSAIDWEEQGIKHVDEAGDGEEALRIITEDQPDIVLLDIKMPKMNGLDVLRAVKERNLPSKVIILSSFDDISYVKEALRLGAYDYFHKPDINERELGSMLSAIREQSGALPTVHSPAGHAAPKKERVLMEALHGLLPDLSETSLHDGNLYVAVFTIKDYDKVMKRYAEQNEGVLPNTMRNLMAELTAKEQELEYVQVDNRTGVVFVSNSEHKSLLASLTRLNGIVQMIGSAMKRFVNVELTFGISDWFSAFKDIELAFKQANVALSHHFYHPEQSIFYHQQLKRKKENAGEQANDYVLQMKTALREDASEKFMSLLTSWEKLLIEEEYMEEKEVRKIYEGLLFMMEQSSPTAGSQEIAEVAEETVVAEDFEQLSASYRQLFRQRLGEKQRQELSGYSQLTRHIIQYVEEHYQESLSLKLLGEEFHISSNYVSRLFKQEVGRGLFDFINEIRIQKAKQLLKDYRYKIYDVAEMVGFNNQAHFAIVFQKYTGVSPKQYRKEQV